MTLNEIEQRITEVKDELQDLFFLRHKLKEQIERRDSLKKELRQLQYRRRKILKQDKNT
jgi:alkylhydroperoxidase/carboxymuconolactone decarboxylase family protein YurZ